MEFCDVNVNKIVILLIWGCFIILDDEGSVIEYMYI